MNFKIRLSILKFFQFRDDRTITGEVEQKYNPSFAINFIARRLLPQLSLQLYLCAR
jgi:hypothetical protein